MMLKLGRWVETCPRCGAEVLLILGATLVTERGTLVLRCPRCDRRT